MRSRGSTPARRNDDLPAPDGPIYLVMRLYWPKDTPPSILPAGEGARDEARMGRDLASDFRAGEVFAAVDVVQVTGPRALVGEKIVHVETG